MISGLIPADPPVHGAHQAIAHQAIAAWNADLARSRELYHAICAAPEGQLLETPEIAALRPAGSISDEVETGLLREACILLGVDPDLHIRRAPGRPRKSAAEGGDDGEAGDFILVSIVDGIVRAKLIAPIAGLLRNTDLATLGVLKLVSLLEALISGGAQLDADLLEAYLDAAAPDWRESAGQADDTSSSAVDDDPYNILGVTRDMPFADITAAYRRAMQAMHPDKGACPAWFAQVAGNAYRKIKEATQGSPQ